MPVARSAFPDAGSPTLVWSGGEARSFQSFEESVVFVSRPLSAGERERGMEALRLAGSLERSWRERTGEQGLTEEDFDDALDAARSH